MYIYGDNGIKIPLPSGGGVDDVQIAHNSIVDEYGVAKIPYATYSTLGMVKPYSSEYASGLYINTYSGDLSISPATLSMIQAAPPDTDVKNPIIPANQHQAVFYGLAKAAGDTYQGGSGYPVGSYIPPAKTAIQEMIGLKIVTQAQYDAIVGADSDGNIYFITED